MNRITRDTNHNCRVYVGNLGGNACKHELEDTFNRYGKIKSVWIARKPPGFAFVEFEDERDAEDAAKALDGSRICGVRATVKMSNKYRHRRYSDRRSNSRHHFFDRRNERDRSRDGSRRKRRELRSSSRDKSYSRERD